MNRILVPLNGSPQSEQVLPYIPALARALDAHVHLVQVVPDWPHEALHTGYASGRYMSGEHSALAWELDTQLLDELRSRVCNYLESAAQGLYAQGLKVTTDIHFGDPARCIVETASNRHCTMIAMATHGYSGIQRWTLGSVTARVIHSTSTPVFVMHMQAHPLSERPATIQRILVPLDGSDFSRQALTFAATLAAGTRAMLHLLHVAVPEIRLTPVLLAAQVPELLQGDVLSQEAPRLAVGEETYQRACQELEMIAQDIRQRGIVVETLVVAGNPADVIVEEALKQASNIIVMATHSYSGIQRLLMGSVADDVLRATATPLVLIHAHG